MLSLCPLQWLCFIKEHFSLWYLSYSRSANADAATTHADGAPGYDGWTKSASPSHSARVSYTASSNYGTTGWREMGEIVRFIFIDFLFYIRDIILWYYTRFWCYKVFVFYRCKPEHIFVSFKTLFASLIWSPPPPGEPDCGAEDEGYPGCRGRQAG